MRVQNDAVASKNTVDNKSIKARPELKLPPSIDRLIAERLVEQARADGVDLVGLNGLLGQLTKQVLETGLEGEMDEYLGYEKHAVEGRDGGNSRNGTRSKTVITEVGPVEVDVPRDRDGTWHRGQPGDYLQDHRSSSYRDERLVGPPSRWCVSGSRVSATTSTRRAKTWIRTTMCWCPRCMSWPPPRRSLPRWMATRPSSRRGSGSLIATGATSCWR